MTIYGCGCKCGGGKNIKHLVKIRFMSQFLNSFILNFHPLHEQKGSPALASYWLLLLLHFYSTPSSVHYILQ